MYLAGRRVPEGKIIAHSRCALELHFIDHTVGKRIEALSRGVRGSRKVGIGLSLGHVLGAGESERRHFCLCQVIDCCEQLERGERAEHDVDLVAFHNLLGLVFCRPGSRPYPRLSESILRPESVKFLSLRNELMPSSK